MLQRNGALLVGQDETVPEPKTEAYAVFSIAIITIWSKLVPVGAADTGLIEVTSETLNTDRVTSSNAKPARFGLWTKLMFCSNPIFDGSRFPCAIGEGFVQCRSEEPDSVCLSEFPGKSYYSLKILKGNLEPRRNLPGSCADLHVDYSMC